MSSYSGADGESENRIATGTNKIIIIVSLRVYPRLGRMIHTGQWMSQCSYDIGLTGAKTYQSKMFYCKH